MLKVLVNSETLTKFNPFLVQWSHFIPPENTRKPKVFRGYKMGTLARNELKRKTVEQHSKAWVEITSGCWKFPPCQAKCAVSKTNKISKTSGC